MKSSILIISHPNPESVKFGADFASSTPSAVDLDYPVIAIAPKNPDDLHQFISRIQKENPTCQLVVSAKNFTVAFLQSLRTIERRSPLLTFYESENFENIIQLAIERYREDQQQNEIQSLTRVQNENLKHTANELHSEIEKHEKKLTRTKKRMLNINVQVDALHKSLLAVHTAESIAEIESLLFTALNEVLDLSWVRIFLIANESLDAQLGRIEGQTLFRESLAIGDRFLGQIVFARRKGKAFTKNEEESLLQIAESVALALDRLAKLDQAENLKLQWESTFDAISEPFCLTDEKFNILKTNKSFLKTTSLKPNQVIGQNCFSIFCGPSAPTHLTPSPAALILQRRQRGAPEPTSYEVTSQRIRVRPGAPSIVLVFFRDITEQKKIEKQIFESSKMAELGTIGSSIAHDINNPLGGMMNFLQLIKMEISTNHEMFDDILQMEQAAQRCKEIVENLLRFSRREDTRDAEVVNLKDVLDRALKIIELQTRPLGIEVDVETPQIEYKIKGHFNLLSQALSHILQNAFDAISEKLQQKPGEKGLIQVRFSSSENLFILTIIDNGVGISPEHQSKILNPLFSTKSKNKYQGLGLTLAYQIVSDHQGQLEIFSQPNVGTTVKISFSNV